MTIPITIDAHCYPRAQRIPRIHKPLQEVCLALLQNGHLHYYEVQQALEALAGFWAAVSNRSKKLEDYFDVFGEKW